MTIARTLAATCAAAALVIGASGCESAIGRVQATGGVPLDQLDTSGPAPTTLALAGPDQVVVTTGPRFAIRTSGDQAAVAALRFELKDHALAILRTDDDQTPGVARIDVTLPMVTELALIGSGQIAAPTMAPESSVTLGGSGKVTVDHVAADQLQLNILGSGQLLINGTANRMALNVAGSGRIAGTGLTVEKAEVNIAGSGGGTLSSNGTVNANVAGSGSVLVYGTARCKVSSMGSGTVRCMAGEPTATAKADF